MPRPPAAMARWNAVGVGLGEDHEFFQVGDPGVSGNVCNRDDGVNEVRFSTSICGLGWGDAIGIARRRVIDGRTVQVDILFNSQVPLNGYPGPLRPAAAGGLLFDFYRLALHEFGHAAGLAHPDDAGQIVDAVMNSAPVADELRLLGAHIVGDSVFGLASGVTLEKRGAAILEAVEHGFVKLGRVGDGNLRDER